MAAKPNKTTRKVSRRVLMIGSEAQPFAKTGGLADVLGALPPALARLGWEVIVALPRYRGISQGSLVERFPITIGGYIGEVGFFLAPLPSGAQALLIDCPDLYDREGLYGANNADYPDNPRRYAMLVRAALEFVGRRDTGPVVVHAHDWQAALAPVYLKRHYASHPVLAGAPTVLTIHNLAYQGLFAPDWLPRLDLPWELLSVDRLEFWGRISFLKGGINESDVITTVSPRYAEEIQLPEFGCGFDGILRQRRTDLVGILNGIDTTEWNPAVDKFLPKPYDARDLSGKTAAKVELMARYGLPTDQQALDRPLVGMVTRLVDQKGLDLLAAASDALPRLNASFVVLGTGEPRYEAMWTRLATEHPDRIGARIGFDEALAHLVEAGADIFLMPSRFEPCGLNQMYSLRYGTVPVVRGVGGLADTVQDYDMSARSSGSKSSTGSTTSTGFVFRDYTKQALLDALGRALTLYADRRRWQALQRAGMRKDHSWNRSAQEYVTIYERLLEARSGGAQA